MADIINLRRVRKGAARRADAAQADANRVLHGVPKGERQSAQNLQRRDALKLDGHRREPRDPT